VTSVPRPAPAIAGSRLSRSSRLAHRDGRRSRSCHADCHMRPSQ
jgi:hypothetical protein